MKKAIFIMVVLFSTVSFSQIKNSFDIRYQTTVRGDMTMISNSILGKVPTNESYNLTGNPSEYNDNINMQFIDVDGDETTFNSSSATLNLADPECSQIVYAGLYWSATYRYETGNNSSSGRFEDWNQVKFKVPSGNYVDITPTNTPHNAQVLYNAFTDPIQTNVAHGSYACYADVTSLVAPLINPNGDYFVGNIRASRDGRSSQGNFVIPGGAAGGWTLIIVYENINLPGKKITTFDGYAVIAASAGNLDIPVSGFVTLPAPLPVNAKLGLIALEGDNRISGDQLQIKANSVASFTNLFNTPSPTAPILNNFFNSSITLNGSYNLSRNPNSINTLGWDSHLNRIINPLNNVIPNDETGVTLRATSTQDKYDIFFTSFDVEIIEPRIDVLNVAESFAGNNINGQSLDMGQEYLYSISFQNNGNDDALNFTISDELPKNVIFPIDGTVAVGDDLILPIGVTYTYDVLLKKFTFFIPNSLVEKNDPIYSIKIKVKVENNCANLEEACSNFITNQVFSSYQGSLNPMIISNNPSSSGFDSCALGIASATNVIANINQCNFIEDEFLCAGNTTILSAPNGYFQYNWLDNNGTTFADTQNITISDFGAYTVTMNSPAPCVSITKTFNVIDCTLANENFTFNNFKSFPNPVKNMFTISNDSPIETIEISSILGQKMISKKVNDIQTEIDLSQLSNGIYFVKVTSQGNEKTIKIVKE